MARQLRLEIEAIDKFSKQLDKLEGDLVQIKTKLDSMGSSGRRAGDGIEEGSKKAGGALSFLRGRFLAVGAVIGATTFAISKLKDAVDEFVDTAGKFEYFRTQLANMYGSVEEGNKVFAKFNEIAATTPFTLERVVQAGVTLRAFTGEIFDPQMVKILADLAAYMGRDIVEAASAMGRAFAGGAGAADVFRETGILTLIKMKTGIQDLTKLTLPEFRKAMFETFLDPKVGIVGATDRLSKTIVGLRSNFEDAVTRIKAAIGEKFLPLYKSALKTAIGIANDFLDMISSQTDKIREQQVEFNALINLLKESNLHETVRAQVIQILNDRYKSYLKNLDLEKATLEELEEAQRRANEEFEKRIKLAIAEKTVQKYQQKIQDLAESLIEAQKDLEKFAEWQKTVDERTREGVIVNDAIYRAVSRRRAEVKRLNEAIRETYKEMENEIQRVMKLRLELGETSTTSDELLKKVSKSLVELPKKTKEAILRQVEELKKAPTKEVAEQIVAKFEALQKKITQLMTELVISPQLPQSKVDEIVSKIEELRNTLSAMEPIYLKAKLIIEKDSGTTGEEGFQMPEIELPPIDDIMNNALQRLRQNSEQVWQEQVQRAMQTSAQIGQAWAQGLEAMNDIERMAAESRWEWEKNFRLQQFEEKWNMLTKEQKKMLGGEAYYQKMRTQIINQAQYEQLQAILSTSSAAVRGFASLMQALSDMGGEQTEAVKALMAVQALIDAYAAINRAFATLPTPLAIVASVGIAANMFANVMKIQSQTVPKPKITPRNPDVKIPPPPTGGKGARTFAGGGVVYINPITGADTVPALLAPGEAVISRRVVTQYRQEVERMITGEPTPQPVSVQITPMINISAVDSQSVAEFVESIDFREALASAIEDGLLRLRVGNIPVEVER